MTSPPNPTRARSRSFGVMTLQEGATTRSARRTTRSPRSMRRHTRAPSLRPRSTSPWSITSSGSSSMAGGTVLDAGCSTGRMTRYVADRGLEDTGVDLSPGMLAMARRDHPDLDVREGSLLSLPVDDASFDGVLLWYSLIHLTDAELPVALAEVFRVVRPDGCVLAPFQVGDGPWDVGRGLRERGHAVALVRHQRGVEPMLDAFVAVGFVEEARLVRAAVGLERHPQAFLLARRPA
ncbi:MAG: class I SAM-dependent methyltransferase [Dermatophilaceae bacterium]